MKLLVIEDEHKTASFLKRGFSEAGFVVDVAPDGPEAMRLIQSGPYDLMVLDLMLPGVDGLHVLTWMRASGVRCPVLILTAKDAVEDRVTGLELGADDYLVKPFAFSELLARVRSILRRPQLREPTVLRVGDLELDLGAYRATRAGQRLRPHRPRVRAAFTTGSQEGRSVDADHDRAVGVGHELSYGNQCRRCERSPLARQGGRSVSAETVEDGARSRVCPRKCGLRAARRRTARRWRFV